MSMGSFGWWGMGFGAIFMLLFWVLIILGIAGLIRYLQASSPPRPEHGRAALELLQARYARGEIEREEFEQKRRDLQQ